jgi:predicted RNase H-like nuclease
VLPYKEKPGRTFADRQAAVRDLLRHIDGLSTAEVPLRVAHHNGWRDISRTVELATRKADLNRVEDRVDAAICAYIALLTVTRPHAVRTLGGADGGEIVIPVTPSLAERMDNSVHGGGAHGRA